MTKSQIPSPKSQLFFIFGFSDPLRDLYLFRIYDLGFGWLLVIGVWDFKPSVRNLSIFNIKVQ